MVDQLFVSPLSRRRVFDAVSRQLEPLISEGARIMVASKTREVTVHFDGEINARYFNHASVALKRLGESIRFPIPNANGRGQRMRGAAV